MLFNRFSRTNYPANLGWELPFAHDDRREHSAPNPPTFRLQSMEHPI